MTRWCIAVLLTAWTAWTPWTARSALAEAVPQAQIVLLGEVHDNAEAHRRQAQVIAQVQPTAVVFEMLSPEAAARADGARGRIAEVTDWAESGWPPFALYAPVFEALGDGQGGGAKIIGMAAPRDQVRAAFREGAAAVFGPQAARFGLDAPLPEPQQAAREAAQFEAHCQAMPREMMGGMVEAQRLRDAVFARAALEALAAHGAPVVLILGSGHARTDWGVPAAIAQAAPEVSTHSLAFVEAAQGAFDAEILVPPAKRSDPCAAFAN